MNTTIEERDHMPHQVATELLTTPKTKLSNRMRKNCIAARAAYHVSERKPKSADEKIRARMKAATSPQLEKWLKRCIARRMGVQEKYLKTQSKTGPKWNYIRALLEATTQRIDTMRDIIEDVLEERRSKHKDSVWNHVHPRRFRTYKNTNLSQAA